MITSPGSVTFENRRLGSTQELEDLELVQCENLETSLNESFDRVQSNNQNIYLHECSQDDSKVFNNYNNIKVSPGNLTNAGENAGENADDSVCPKSPDGQDDTNKPSGKGLGLGSLGEILATRMVKPEPASYGRAHVKKKADLENYEKRVQKLDELKAQKLEEAKKDRQFKLNSEKYQDQEADSTPVTNLANTNANSKANVESKATTESNTNANYNNNVDYNTNANSKATVESNTNANPLPNPNGKSRLSKNGVKNGKQLGTGFKSNDPAPQFTPISPDPNDSAKPTSTTKRGTNLRDRNNIDSILIYNKLKASLDSPTLPSDLGISPTGKRVTIEEGSQSPSPRRGSKAALTKIKSKVDSARDKPLYYYYPPAPEEETTEVVVDTQTTVQVYDDCGQAITGRRKSKNSQNSNVDPYYWIPPKVNTNLIGDPKMVIEA